MTAPRLVVTKADLEWAVELATKALNEWDSSLDKPLKNWTTAEVIWTALAIRNGKSKRRWKGPKAIRRHFFNSAEMLYVALLGCRAHTQHGGRN